MKSETVIACHSKGFGPFWKWEVRRGQWGRPPASKESRELIRKMSQEDYLWVRRGSSRIPPLLGIYDAASDSQKQEKAYRALES